MKKFLLLLLSLLPLFVFSQENISLIEEEEITEPTSLDEKFNPDVAAVTCVNLGMSGNAYSTAFGAKTALYADPDLNTIALTRKSDLTTAPTTGYIYADVSTNGGLSFTTNVGPLYNPGTFGTRYPQGIIFKNPLFPTVADSAFLAYFSSITNGASWAGNAHGVGRIGAPLTPTQTISFATPIYSGLIADSEILTSQGVIWNIGIGIDPVLSVYNDSIILHKGIWNSSTRDFDYTRSVIYAPAPGISRTSIAFGPNGLTGYAVILVSGGAPIIFKTTNGGITWASTSSPPLGNLGLLLTGSPGSYLPGYEIDTQVDANNNLHMIMAVGPDILGNLGTTPGTWGMFDIYTPNGGTSWKGTLLAKPQTFRGIWGTVSEDSRPQICCNTTHTKLVFCWFDTDTIIYSSSNGNFYPDLWARGFNVGTGKWSPKKNLTGTSPCAQGTCTFGLVANYGFFNAINCTIPVSTLQLLTDELNPCQHVYLKGATLSAFGWTLNLSTSTTPLKEVSTTSVNEATDENSISIYPNPSNGMFQLAIANWQSAKTELEIFNTLGQKVYQSSIVSNQSTIDMRGKSKGIYFIKLQTDGRIYTKKVIIH